MLYKLKVVQFSSSQLCSLKDKAKSQALFPQLYNLICCSPSQFQKHLHVFVQLLKYPDVQEESYYYLKTIYFNYILIRLNQIDSQNIRNERQFVSDIFKLHEFFNVRFEFDHQLMLYLAGRLKDICFVFELMEEHIIEKFVSFKQEDQKTFIKEFLARKIRQLQKQQSALPHETENNFQSKDLDLHLIQLKCIKLYSWIVNNHQDQILTKCSWLNHPSIIQIEELVIQFVQIKCIQSHQLIKKIMKIEIKQPQQSFQFENDLPINSRLLDIKLFNTIFKTASEYHDFLNYFSQKQNHIILHFNLLKLSSQTFANIADHSLILKHDEPSQIQQAKIFLTIFKQLISLLQKIASGYKISVLNIQKGDIQTKQLSKAQKQKVIIICLQVWSNIHKLIQISSQKFKNYRNLNNILFLNYHYTPANIARIFNALLSFCQSEIMQIVDKICFIEKHLARIRPESVQIFNTLKFDKFIFILENYLPEQIGKSILFFWCNYSQKLKNKLVKNNPFNNENLVAFLYDLVSNQLRKYQLFRIKGPYFFNNSLIRQDIPSINILPNTFPVFLNLIECKYNQILNKIKNPDSLKSIVLSEELKYLLKDQHILRCQKIQLDKYKDSLKIIIQVKPEYLSDWPGQSLSDFFRYAGVNIEESIIKTCNQLLQFMSQQENLKIDNQSANFWQKIRSQHLKQTINKLYLLRQLTLILKSTKMPLPETTINLLLLVIKKTLTLFKQNKRNLQELYEHLGPIKKYDFLKSLQILDSGNIRQNTFDMVNRIHILKENTYELFQLFLRYLNSQNEKSIIYFIQRCGQLLEISFINLGQTMFQCFQIQMLNFLLKEVQYYGQIFYLIHYKKIEELIQTVYSKIIKLLQKQQISSNQDLIQFQQNTKTHLQTLFKHIFTLNSSTKKMIFNKLECKGNLAYRCLATSFLVHMLNKLEAKGSEESFIQYQFVINEMCNSLIKLNNRRNDIKQIKDLSIQVNFQSMTMLEFSNFESVGFQTKRRIIKRLYDMKSQNNHKIFISISLSLFKTIERQKVIQFADQFTSTIWKQLQTKLEIAEAAEIMVQLDWLSIVFEKKQVNILKNMTVKLIQKLLLFIKNTKIQPQPEGYLRTFFLERLLPSTFPNPNCKETIDFTANILDIILKLNEIDNSPQSSEILLSIFTKILSSKIPTLFEYLPHFTKNQEFIPNNLGDVLCNILSKQALTQNLQAQILAFLYKNELLSDHNPIKVKLNTFIYEFKQKDPQQLETISKILRDTFHVTYEQIISEKVTYLVFDKQVVKSYQEDAVFGSKLIYKPSVTVASILNYMMEQYSKKQYQSFSISYFAQLTKVFFNFPILLPYVAFHKINHKQHQSLELFVDFIIELAVKQISNDNIETLLGQILMEYNSIIQINNQLFLVVELIAHRFVTKFSKMQLNYKTLWLILYLSQFKYFVKMCWLRKEGGSLKQLLQKELLKCRINPVQTCDKKLIILKILSILYRQQPVEHIKHRVKWDRKNQKYLHINYSLVAFQCLQTRSQESTKRKEVSKIQIQSVIQYQLQQTIEMVNNGYEDKVLKDDLGPIKCSQEILQLMGNITKSMMRWTTVLPIQRQVNNSFLQLVRSMKVLINPIWMSKFNLRESIIFHKRRKEKDYKNQPNIRDYEQAVQRSSYAAQDYNNTYISHIQQNQDQNQQETHSDKQIQRILLASLKQFKINKQTKNKTQSTEKKTTLNETNSQEIMAIMQRINHNYRQLNRKQIELNELKQQNLQELLQWMRLKELESDFDLKQQTMSTQDFQAYCLSNAFKLQRLNSTRRNKVKQIQDFCLQTYISRTPSSDSIDYMIDTLDQNYQHLAFPQSNVTQQSESHEENIKMSKKSMQITIDDCPEQIFEEIGDQVLFQFISLFYMKVGNLKYQNFIPFLQNRKAQAKLITSLIAILQQPYNSQSIFPKKMMQFGKADQQVLDEETIKKIKTNIINFICSLYYFGFYGQENFLLREISSEGVKNTFINKESIKQNMENTLHFRYSPFTQIAKRVFSVASEISNKCIFRIFRGVKKIDSNLIEILIEHLKKMSLQSKNYDNQYLLSQIEAWNFKDNFASLSVQPTFVESIKKQLTLNLLQEKPYLIEFYLTSNIFSKQELISVHQNVLSIQNDDFEFLYFLSEITRIYTDQEIRDADWLIKYQAKYEKLFSQYIQNNDNIKQAGFFRIFVLNKYTYRLPITIKKHFMIAQIQSILKQNNIDNEQTHIYAKRKQGIFLSAFQDLRYKPKIFWYIEPAVRYVNEDGKVESGYGVGVGKDWYTQVTKGMVNLNYGLFTKTSSNYYFFNRESWINPRHLQYFEFIGKLFAMSLIRNDYFVAPNFSLVIYKMILGEKIDIEDLKTQFDEGEVIINVEKLRQFTDDSMFWQSFVYQDKKLISKTKIDLQGSQNYEASNNVYLLRETIEIGKSENEQINMPKTAKVYKVGEAHELIPGGSEIPVTLSNLQQYISLTKAKIYDLIIGDVKKQSNAFLQGFKQVLDIKSLFKFTAQELRRIVEGSDKISIESLKQNVILQGFKFQDELMQWFWSILQSMSGEDRSHFMQHWTGTSKLPVQELELLQMQIAKSRNAQQKRIFAQTCFNRINLPPFSTRQELQEAMWTAINSIKMGFSMMQDQH